MPDSKAGPKWTPGPWYVGAMNDALFIVTKKPSPSGSDVPVDIQQPGIKVITKIEGWDGLSTDLANARLIAAAPGLYEALEDMLWPIRAGCQKPMIARCKCAKCVEDRARAALAKARGEVAATGIQGGSHAR